MFNITGCNSIKTIRWAGYLISLGIEDDNIGYKWTYPILILDVQFDGETRNLTVEDYLRGTPIGRNDVHQDDLFVPGKVMLTFSGAIDTHHFDVFVNDGATPSWERTVRCGNDSSNIGYSDTNTSASSSLQSSGALSFLGLALMLSIASYIL